MNDPVSGSDIPPLLPASPTPETRRVGRWRWWIHLLLLAAYPLFIGVVGWEKGAARGPALSETSGGLLFVCAVELLIFGLVFGLAWLASRASRDDLLLRWRNGFWTVPLGIGYSVALRVAVGLAMVVTGAVLVALRVTTPPELQHFMVANRPDVEAIVDVSAMRQNPAYYWLIVTFVSFVLAGLREELWRAGFLGGTRALWPKRFGTRAGQIGAVAIAAVVFGIGHLTQGPLMVGIAALLGFGLGLIMVLHRSVWPAVIAHGMFDATSLALLPWAMEQLHRIQPALGH